MIQQGKHKESGIVLSLFAIFILVSCHLHGQEDDPFFTNRLPYITKIRAEFPGRGEFPGFGFVVSLDEEYVYIATAAHVVFPNASLGKSSTIHISWADKIESQLATIVQLDKSLDIALLKVTKPPKLDWHYLYRYSETSIGEKVWIIGIRGEWEKPSSNNIATISNISSKQISVNFNRVTGGSSGGPVLNNKGIVGMIIADTEESSGERTVGVLPIAEIMNKVSSWLPSQPANRAVFPFISIGLGTSYSASALEGIFRSSNRKYDATGWSISTMAEVAWTPFLSTRVQYAPRRLIGRKNEDIPFKNTIHDLSGSVVFYPFRSNVNTGIGIGLFVGANKFWHQPALQLDGSSWVPLGDIPGVNYDVPKTNNGFHVGGIIGGYWKRVFLEMSFKYVWTNGAYFYKELPAYDQVDTKNDQLILVDFHLSFSTKKYKRGGYILTKK